MCGGRRGDDIIGENGVPRSSNAAKCNLRHALAISMGNCPHKLTSKYIEVDSWSCSIDVLDSMQTLHLYNDKPPTLQLDSSVAFLITLLNRANLIIVAGATFPQRR